MFLTPPKCRNVQNIQDWGMGGKGSLDYIDYAVKNIKHISSKGSIHILFNHVRGAKNKSQKTWKKSIRGGGGSASK